MLNLKRPIQIPLSECKDSQEVPQSLDEIYNDKCQVYKAKMSWLHQRNFGMTLLKDCEATLIYVGLKEEFNH